MISLTFSHAKNNYTVKYHLQQYFSYIVVVCFINGWSWSIQRYCWNNMNYWLPVYLMKKKF